MQNRFSIIKVSSAVLIASSALLVTACGGGGVSGVASNGGGGNSDSPKALAITESNAQKLASVAVRLEALIPDSSTYNSGVDKCPTSGQLKAETQKTYNTATGKTDIAGKITATSCHLDSKVGINGTLNITGSSYQNAVDVLLTGQLNMEFSGVTKTLSASDIKLLVNDDKLKTSSNFSLTLSGSMMKSSYVKVQTSTNIETGNKSENPSVGVIRITGDKNSVVVVEYDSSEKGVYISVNGGPTDFLTWSQLNSVSLTSIN
ncbi:hypothetical protein [Hahella sp. HN01]|uniref:hypothetical protein n=1 Tax=Hahella sp. HN01 TaxID=2847262 RepID=UPI001C1E8DB0|nr:hypothetical protein [Hahella sp. HN01]MBU6953505.1 hypothetical protein [Hahella sp. HN01]